MEKYVFSCIEILAQISDVALGFVFVSLTILEIFNFSLAWETLRWTCRL